MNRIDENKLINEAFKPYRFENSFKSKEKNILTESEQKEFELIYNELYENLELIRVRYPELYNEFVGKMLGKAAGKVVNTAGRAKDYVKSIPGRVANWAKEQADDAKDAYADERNKRLSKIPGRKPVQGSGRSGGSQSGNTNTGESGNQNLPPSVKQQQYNHDRFSNTFNAVSKRGFADQKALNTFINSPAFQSGYKNLLSSSGINAILGGKNPQLLKLAIASYLVGTQGNRVNKQQKTPTKAPPIPPGVKVIP